MGLKTATVFKCANCHAVLPAAAGVVMCSYCKAENVIERLTAEPVVDRIVAEPAFDAAPPAQPYAQIPKSSGAGCTAFAIVSGLLIAGICAGIFVLSRSHGESGESGVFGLASVFEGSLYASTDNLCLFDANGDGVLDAAGVGSASEGQSILAYDGRTGKQLWRSLLSGENQQNLHCSGDAKLITSHGTFVVERLDPATGKIAWSARLPDKIQAVTGGRGCVRFDTIDKSVTTMDWTTGKPAPCVAQPKTGNWNDGEWSTRGVAIGNYLVKVSGTTQGTPRTAVEVSEGTKVLWKKTLELTQETFLKPVQVADGFVVAGHIPGDEKRTAVIYVRAAQAEVVWTREDRSDHFAIGSLAVGDKKVFALSGNGLTALDIATGKALWSTK